MRPREYQRPRGTGMHLVKCALSCMSTALPYLCLWLTKQIMHCFYSLGKRTSVKGHEPKRTVTFGVVLSSTFSWMHNGRLELSEKCTRGLYQVTTSLEPELLLNHNELKEKCTRKPEGLNRTPLLEVLITLVSRR